MVTNEFKHLRKSQNQKDTAASRTATTIIMVLLLSTLFNNYNEIHTLFR